MGPAHDHGSETGRGHCRYDVLLLLGNCSLRAPLGLSEPAESSAVLTVLQEVRPSEVPATRCQHLEVKGEREGEMQGGPGVSPTVPLSSTQPPGV